MTLLRRFSNALLLAVAFTCFSAAANAQPPQDSWPQFLGPARNGQSAATKLIQQWPENGPAVIWEAQTGAGMSGVALGKDKLFTLGEVQGQQCLIAVNLKDGKMLFATPLAPAYENAMGNGPRGTPSLQADIAYAFTGDGVLAAVAAATGELIWKVDAVKETGAKIADYGMACSPLLVGKLVIVNLRAPGPSVAAFAAEDGKLVWQAGDDPAGYSSPILVQLQGKQQIVTFTGASVLGLDLQGKTLWRLPFVTDYGCNTACPVVVGEKLLLSAGENHGSLLVNLQSGTPRELWSSTGASSVLQPNGKPPSLSTGKPTLWTTWAAPVRSRT